MESRPSKRRRTDSQKHEEAGIISSVEDLQKLLQYRPQLTPQIKNSVNEFKTFLTSIVREENESSRAQRLVTLQKFCEYQSADSQDKLDFPDIIATWYRAVEVGDDAIASTVPAALSQFFRTISGNIELRSFGRSLCHSLLKREQARLFDRGLSSSGSKPHLISPCLRLLTEIVSFDGGALANYFFSRRDVLLKRFDVLLQLEDGDPVDRRRPTVRRMALRLLIACLKFLDSDAKSEFITHGRIGRMCLQGLVKDGDDIVLDVISALDAGFVEDSNIPRSSKSRFFHADNLLLLAALYDYDADPSHPTSATNVREGVQSLLIKVCTTRKVLLANQNDWYPVGFEANLRIEREEDYIDLGLDSPLYFDDYTTNVPVKNMTLSAFVHKLRPELDTLQSALLLRIFRSAPELVADFFSKKPRLPTTSSDDNTWRGAFAFLFSVCQLPIPRNFGWHEDLSQLPPPISVTIENILPRPLDQVSTTRYFTLNDEILTLSGCRLLITALEKLESILQVFKSANKNHSMWQQGSARLLELVLQRVPKLKDITEAVLRCNKSNEDLRLSLFQCIATYHKVLPEATSNSKFDVGPIIQLILSRVSTGQESEAVHHILCLQLQQLVIVARLSVATRWWKQSGGDSLSLFTSLLQHAMSLEHGDERDSLLKLLEYVSHGPGFLNRSAKSFTALHNSLSNSGKFIPSNALFTLFDNAIHRCVQKPVRYLDQIEAIQRGVSDQQPLSLLACAMTEQWQFALKKYVNQTNVTKNISLGIARFFDALDAAGENFRAIANLRDEMMKVADEKTQMYLEKAFDKIRKRPVTVQEAKSTDIGLPNSGIPQLEIKPGRSTKPNGDEIDLVEVLGMPTSVPQSLGGLDKWNIASDIDVDIKSSRLGILIRCLASSEDETRRGAFQLLQNVAYGIDQSEYSEKNQIFLLLGEICETARRHGFDEALPAAVAELGAKLTLVLADPAHGMFGTANRFLLLGPAWDLQRLISYWADRILLHMPESEDQSAWGQEVDWLLTWLEEGLKSAHDMEFYRRAGIFERILALYAAPALSRNLKRSILTIVWRAICVGGADTLVTRVGLDRWLGMMEVMDKEHCIIIKALKGSLADACDKKAIAQWRTAIPQSRTSTVIK